MKKTFLDFHKVQVRRAPRVQNKRMGIGHVTTRFIPHLADGGTPEAATETEAIEKIGQQVEQFKTLLGDKADAAVIKELSDKVTELSKGIEAMKADDAMKLIKEINEGNQKLFLQVAELQEQQAKAFEGTAGNAKKEKIFTEKEAEDFVKEMFGEKVDGKYSGKKSKGFSGSLVISKAAETFGWGTFFTVDGTDATAFTGRYIDPTLYQRRRKRNLILDNFTIGRINVPTLVYLVKVEDGDDANSTSGDSGSAAWITSGGQKPQRSFKVTTGVAEAKKVAIFATAEDKLLRDVASLDRWIREDLMMEMREEINDGLLNNNPAVNSLAPLGLKTNATQYTATPAYNNVFTASTTTYIDQIFALNARMAYTREEPGIVFVASDVYYRIMHLKDSDSRYLNNNLVYTDAMGRLFIGGTEVIWADQDDIPATHVLAVARDLGFKIYAYGPMVLETGLNGEDFRYDRTSYRAYQEFLTFIPENRENSVIYDTWANIKAAIEA